jgi:hypothetical protein
VQIAIDDWSQFEPLNLGLALAVSLRRLYPTDWNPEGLLRLVADRATYDAVLAGSEIATIRALWTGELQEFQAVRSRYLLYD